MGRPRHDDEPHREKRARFDDVRAKGTSLRDCAAIVGIATSTAQESERDRRHALESQPDFRTRMRVFLQTLIDEGFPEEVGRASQVYWRVRLASPPDGASAWRTEHLAVFVSQVIDIKTPREVFEELGDEGLELWPQYLAAMGRRAGLTQRDDGSWVADPDREPRGRA